ncbi:MAG: hypothetical protein RR744_09015 [Cellulosilyticaceae bacterium]
MELIYYPESYSVVEKFLNEAKNNKAFPHSYAAYRIIEQLSSLLFDKSYIENKLLWKEIDIALGIEAEGII